MPQSSPTRSWLQTNRNPEAIHHYQPQAPSGPLTLDEQMIFGSSREGVINRGLNLSTATLPTTTFSNLIGDKQYQHSNHLGNVLATVSDVPLADNGGSGSTLVAWNTYYLSSHTYSSFGAKLVDGATNWGTDYRYGFNGMEGDDEVKGDGNSYDFGARMYDSRLGRWLSRDFFESSYSSHTSYNFCINSPIVSVDFEGDKVVFAKGSKEVFDSYLSRFNKVDIKKNKIIKSANDFLKITESDGIYTSNLTSKNGAPLTYKKFTKMAQRQLGINRDDASELFSVYQTFVDESVSEIIIYNEQTKNLKLNPQKKDRGVLTVNEFARDPEDQTYVEMDASGPIFSTNNRTAESINNLYKNPPMRNDNNLANGKDYFILLNNGVPVKNEETGEKVKGQYSIPPARIGDQRIEAAIVVKDETGLSNYFKGSDKKSE